MTDRRDQVRHGLAKNVLGVLGPSAASRTVEGVDRLAVVCGDQAARFANGLGRQLVFGVETTVDLALVRRANVVASIGKLTEISQNVGPCGNRLCLERLDLRKRIRGQFVRNHAQKIVFQRKFVNDNEGVLTPENFNPPPVLVSIDSEPRRTRFDFNAGIHLPHQNGAIVYFDCHSPFQILGPNFVSGDSQRDRRRKSGAPNGASFQGERFVR